MKLKSTFKTKRKAKDKTKENKKYYFIGFNNNYILSRSLPYILVKSLETNGVNSMYMF